MKILILILLISKSTFAEEKNLLKTTTIKEPISLIEEGYPYIPPRIDYSLELGLGRMREDLLWLAGNVGRATGECWPRISKDCQLFFDGIIGIDARDGYTDTSFLSSLRYQFVQLPNRRSYFSRAYLGAARLSRIDRPIKWVAEYGVGVGVTSYLHNKVDMRLEARFGNREEFYGLILLGVQFKVDRLLGSFVDRLKDFGIGTVKTAIEAGSTAVDATTDAVKATSKAVKATGNVVKDAVKGGADKQPPPAPPKN